MSDSRKSSLGDSIQSNTENGGSSDSTSSQQVTMRQHDEARPQSISSIRESSGRLVKKRPEDFIFGKVIGEGSFSMVFLAKEIETEKEYAIKVCEKHHIKKERKVEYIMREKEVFAMLNHPFFVKLFYTFQDEDRLYFVLSYAERGELLHYIRRLNSFDLETTQFYAAEIVLALDHLHSLGIIHRDLKPENILLNKDLHIQITDFGSTKILDNRASDRMSTAGAGEGRRRNSFVGTAQYVSPEVLTSKSTCFASDLWALGCIIYQLLGGLTPFRGGHEYQIFQKIQKLDYSFPEGFDPNARDLVENLLVIDPTKRLGCAETGGFEQLKAHPFFNGIIWDTLTTQKAPAQIHTVHDTGKGETKNIWNSGLKPGYDDQQIYGISDSMHNVDMNSEIIEKSGMSTEERLAKLHKQNVENNYHKFVENHLIIKQGLVDKKRGLFSRRRMLLLTEGPHMYYVDPVNMELKGQIPWSRELRPEAKNFKIFFVHTPNRTYYLDDPEGYALEWVGKIQEVWDRYYSTPKPKKSS